MEALEEALTEIIDGAKMPRHCDLTEMLEEDLTEIIDGQITTGPSPFGKHQDIVFNLADILRRHVKGHKLGKVFLSPLDVIFEEGLNSLQPDILFIANDNMHIYQDWIRGVPDMVCEVVSQYSYERDTKVKRVVYEKFKVPEFWIVFPELREIQILTYDDGTYKLHCVAVSEGTVNSKVIDGLLVDIKDVFAD
ncbi:MAG: Uma2 family endonuclease [Nitrospirae bacterium]|nr:Uma2 family endonuclease [Nitrospirota bacterium]